MTKVYSFNILRFYICSSSFHEYIILGFKARKHIILWNNISQIQGIIVVLKCFGHKNAQPHWQMFK